MQWPTWRHWSTPWADDPAAKRLLKRNEWLTGPKSRLPRHYVEFYKKWEIGPQAYIHDEPAKANFEKDEFGNVRKVQNPRIPVLYPDEFHQGLWGGEGIVKGGRERLGMLYSFLTYLLLENLDSTISKHKTLTP